MFEWDFEKSYSPPTGSPVELKVVDRQENSYRFSSGRSGVTALNFFAIPHFSEVRIVAQSNATGSKFSLTTVRAGAINLEGSGESDLTVQVVDSALANAKIQVRAAEKLSIDGCFFSDIQGVDETSIDVASQPELESQLGADFDVEETDSDLRIGSDRFGNFAVSFDVQRETCTLTAVVESNDFGARIELAGLRSITCSSTGTEAKFVFRLRDGGTLGVYLDSSVRVELNSATT